MFEDEPEGTRPDFDAFDEFLNLNKGILVCSCSSVLGVINVVDGGS